MVKVGRIIGENSSTRGFNAGNIALEEMKVNGSLVSSGNHDDENGKGVSLDQVYDKNFWENLKWSGEWIFEDNMALSMAQATISLALMQQLQENKWQ